MRHLRTVSMIFAALAVLCLAAAPVSAQTGRRIRRAERRIERRRIERRRIERRRVRHELPRGQFVWSGSVDDVTQIFLSRTEVREQRVSGKSTENVRFTLGNPLPRRHVRVYLRQVRGRGRVRTIQQPTSFNRYTAGVEIRDKAPGRGRYRFVLAW